MYSQWRELTNTFKITTNNRFQKSNKNIQLHMYKDESLRMRVACIIFLQLTEISCFFVTQLIKYFRIIQMDSLPKLKIRGIFSILPATISSWEKKFIRISQVNVSWILSAVHVIHTNGGGFSHFGQWNNAHWKPRDLQNFMHSANIQIK